MSVVHAEEPLTMTLPSRGTMIWFAVTTFMAACLVLRATAPWLISFPTEWTLPVTSTLNTMMTWIVDATGPFFRAVSGVLDAPMRGIRNVLNWMPWSLTIFLLVVTAYAASGWKLAVFTAAALGYMVGVGLWGESMNSLGLVVMSVPLAVLVGFGFGTLGFFRPRAERAILSMLDLLQTIPAFAYLLPILLLFGFGPVVGLIASVLFAFPPMVRNTLLGLRRVSPEVIESGLMSGATGAQLFWQVRVPSALKQILLGINQTTMAAFSMVIIASIIGGSSDIGWEVLLAIRKAQFGESLVAGLVIALMAMVMDRITAGFARKDTPIPAASDQSVLARHPALLVAGGGGIAVYVLSLFVPALAAYPEAWQVDPAPFLDRQLEAFLASSIPFSDGATVRSALAALKTNALFYLMLPLKIGLEQTISPYSWGFEFTLARKLVFAAIIAGLAALAWLRWSPLAAIVVVLAAIAYFVGIPRLPWPAVVLAMVILAWQLAGWRLAAGVLASMAFLLLSGVWPQTMLSVYLCGIAVALSFTIGTVVGILASEFPMVSRIVRPINDTLQTMPLFVLLIPFVTIFRIGEFTALLAIIAYSIVPAIRYAEHGLRSVSSEVVEAANCMGCTRMQLLMQVKLPLAAPVMMLGLNQTIMYGISMLVIAALVGTNGLGQQVYIGLGDADFGVGMVAGLGMAIIAIIADRMTQAWSAKRGLVADTARI